MANGNVTSQSEGCIRSQRFWAFLFTVAALNGTLFLATKISAPQELSANVIAWECIVGIVLVLGRTGVHLAEAFAAARLGKPADSSAKPQ